MDSQNPDRPKNSDLSRPATDGVVNPRDERRQTEEDIPPADRMLLNQARAMVRYASRKGIPIDPAAAASITASQILLAPEADRLKRAHEEWKYQQDQIHFSRRPQPTGNDSDPMTGDPPQPADQVLLADFDASVRQRLVRAHNRLANAIQPALPETVLLLEQQRVVVATSQRKRGWLGPIPLIRVLTGSALVVLIVVILLLALAGTLAAADNGAGQGLTVAAPVSFATVSVPDPDLPLGLVDIGAEWSAFLQGVLDALALLGTAYLGAVFAVLYRLRTKVLEGTYRQDHDFAYVSEIVLGLIAGFILATFVQIRGGEGLPVDVTQPLLALIGGFSAAVVYRIISQIARGLEAIFQPDPEERISSEVQAARSRATAEHVRNRESWRSQVIAARAQLTNGEVADATTILDDLTQSMDV